MKYSLSGLCALFLSLVIPWGYSQSADVSWITGLSLIQENSLYFSGIETGVMVQDADKQNEITLVFPLVFYDKDNHYLWGTYGYSFAEISQPDKEEAASAMISQMDQPLNMIHFLESFRISGEYVTLDYRNHYIKNDPLSQTIWNHSLYRNDLPHFSRLMLVQSGGFSLMSNSLPESNRYVAQYQADVLSQSGAGIISGTSLDIYGWYFHEIEKYGGAFDAHTNGWDFSGFSTGIFAGASVQADSKESIPQNRNTAGVRFRFWNTESRVGYLNETINSSGNVPLAYTSFLAELGEENPEKKNTSFVHGMTLQFFWKNDLPFLTDLLDLLVNQIQFSPVRKKELEIVLDTFFDEQITSTPRVQLSHYGNSYSWHIGYTENKLSSYRRMLRDENNSFIFFRFDKPIVRDFLFFHWETYNVVSQNTGNFHSYLYLRAVL